MNHLTPDYVKRGTYFRLNEEEVQIIINNLDREGFKIFKDVRFIKPVSLNNGESFDTWKLDEAAIYCHYTELMTQLVFWIKSRIEEASTMKDCIKEIMVEGLVEDGRSEVKRIIKVSKGFEKKVATEFPHIVEESNTSISGNSFKRLSFSENKVIEE